MDISLAYKPSEWGALFHATTQHEVFGAGAAGPGKSLVLLADPFEQIVIEHQRCLDPKHPYPLRWGESQGWALHLRRETPQLLQTLERARTMFFRLDPDVVEDKANKIFRFKSGFKYQFSHCKESGDWQNFQSNQYTHIGYDELVQFEEEQYHQINTRLRCTDPVLKNMLKIRAMSNPFAQRDGTVSVKDPHWVRRRFVEPCPEGRKVLKKQITRGDGRVEYRTRLYLPATLYDNPDPEFVEQYEATLLDKPAHIRQAMLYGDWFVSPGAFYGDDWNKEIHVCRPFTVPAHWPVLRTMDWGFKSWGTIIWWAIDDDGTMYAIREFSFRMMKAEDVAKEVKRIEKGMSLWHGGRSSVPGFADTQLWEERGDGGLTKAESFSRVGVSWTAANKKSRKGNAEKFLARLRDHNEYSSRPGIVFFETCRRSIATIPSIPGDPHDPSTPKDGGDDHWHDAVLYACAAASRGKVGVSQADSSRRFYEEDDEDMERSARRAVGRYGYGSEVG